MVTAGGKYVHRNKVRAAFRIVAFLGLLGIFWATVGEREGDEVAATAQHRRLEGTDATGEFLRALEDGDPNATTTNSTLPACTNSTLLASPNVGDRKYMLAPYILGVLYIFVSLAVVCDEYFVPALEEMAGPKHMDLSMDIAGATLMAAGGSAPELFTSFVGTFQESSVGFGTIIGSAVFNVLFVIGVCAVCAPRPLELTWWPLFRDCTYYSISLVVLALFFEDQLIELWEAGVLFGLYLGYIVVMYFNVGLYKLIVRNILQKEIPKDDPAFKDNVAFFNPSMFRMGIVHYLSQPGDAKDSAGVGIVTQIRGDVHEVFRELDKDNDGHIDVAELHEMFRLLGCKMTDEQVEESMKELDTNGDNQMSSREFSAWYLKSEQRVESEIKNVFDSMDVNKNGTIEISEVGLLFSKLNYHAPPEELRNAVKEIQACVADAALCDEGCGGQNPETVNYCQFKEWYSQSLFWTTKVEEGEAAAETDIGFWDGIRPPENASCLGYVTWFLLLPIMTALTFTIPDVRCPGQGKWCYLAFLMSIAWIGIMSYFMVLWTETIGNTFNIPSIIMGLTFLAAGTSVPDLLSSVVVAKKGYGDMAVSSSIGSNIFDITVGLPLPWLAYCLYPNNKASVAVAADSVFLNILILLGMLIAVVSIIMLSSWRMTKPLGASMFVLYIVYVVQAVYFEYQNTGTEDCV